MHLHERVGRLAKQELGGVTCLETLRATIRRSKPSNRVLDTTSFIITIGIAIVTFMTANIIVSIMVVIIVIIVLCLVVDAAILVSPALLSCIPKQWCSHPPSCLPPNQHS
jgi:hypothetical protein